MAVKIRIDGDTQDFEKKLKDLDTIGEKALKGIKIAAAAAGAALLAIGTYAFNVGKDFEAGMSGVQAVLQGTELEMQQLSALAKEMGATTVYSATQAAEALQYIAQAGYDAAGATSLLPDVLNLAATDAMDLGVAAQYVTNGLAIFGEAAGGAAHYSDLLATTAAAADGSVSDMAEAFMVAGGQAMLAGLDMDELATAVGVLANNGIKGSEGGTHLRNALKNLYTPTDDAAAAMAELGIQTRNADGTLVGMQDVLQQFQERLSGLDDAARLDYMGRIFDTRTLAAANALINSSGESWDELARAMDGAEGAAARMAEIKLDNLEGDITLLKSATEGFGIQLYESFGTAARSAVQGLTASVETLMRAFDQPEVRAAVSSIGDAVGTLVKTVGNVVATVLPALIKGLGLVADNLDTILPITLGLVAAFKLFSIVGTVTSAFSALQKTVDVASAMLVKNTALTGANLTSQTMLSAALASQTTAELVRAAAKKAGMTIDAAGNLITAQGAVATAAETATVLASSGALTAKTVIVGLLTGTVTLATAAQWLWNAAMAANPIGLIIAGVVALAAVLVGLVALFNKESEALKELKADTEKVIDANKRLQEDITTSAAQFDENSAAIENNAALADNLAGKIFELQASYDGSAASAAKMRILIEQLNAAVPDLNLAFDEQTGKLNMTEAAVRALTAAQKEQMLAQARAARANELALELVKQEEALQDLRDQYAEWELALENGEISQSKFENNTRELSKEIAEAETSVGNLNAQIDEYIDASTEASLAADEQATAAAFSAENLESLAEKYGTTAEAIRAATDGTVASLDAWIAEQDALAASTEETNAAMQARYNELADVAQNAFGRIEQAQALSMSQMTANLNANADAVTAYTDNLAAASSNLANYPMLQPLIDELAAGGPEYADQLGVLANATEEELAAMADAFANGGDAAMAAMLAEFGLPANTNMGSDAVDDIAAGVEGNEALTTACEAAVNDAVLAMNTAISAANMPGIGRDMVSGIADGIRNGGGMVATALVGAIQNAITAAKSAAETASPSKKTRRELGLPLAQGVALGIEDGTPLAVAAAGDQMGAVFDEYSSHDMPNMVAQFMAEYPDVPMDFFAMGRDAGEEWVAGFQLAALGFMSLLENILFGAPAMASVPASAPPNYYDVDVNFNQPVDSPDTTTRAVRDVFEFGLAGERN